MTLDDLLAFFGWCTLALAVYGLARWVGLSV
jgi:hypothetical protein